MSKQRAGLREKRKSGEVGIAANDQ